MTEKNTYTWLMGVTLLVPLVAYTVLDQWWLLELCGRRDEACMMGLNQSMDLVLSLWPVVTAIAGWFFVAAWREAVDVRARLWSAAVLVWLGALTLLMSEGYSPHWWAGTGMGFERPVVLGLVGVPLLGVMALGKSWRWGLLASTLTTAVVLQVMYVGLPLLLGALMMERDVREIAYEREPDHFIEVLTAFGEVEEPSVICRDAESLQAWVGETFEWWRQGLWVTNYLPFHCEWSHSSPQMREWMLAYLENSPPHRWVIDSYLLANHYERAGDRQAAIHQLEYTLRRYRRGEVAVGGSSGMVDGVNLSRRRLGELREDSRCVTTPGSADEKDLFSMNEVSDGCGDVGSRRIRGCTTG